MTRTPALRWTVHSSAEQRSGRYTIVEDWTDTEVRVLIDGQPVTPGFGTIAEAKDYCLKHHLGAIADRHMIDGARNMIPEED